MIVLLCAFGVGVASEFCCLFVYYSVVGSSSAVVDLGLMCLSDCVGWC